jgi:hypothetical protein|tara:strand:- start:3058 stop:4965 length:1908 start_codon:yes stop_codon:yes gene_type:complete
MANTKITTGADATIVAAATRAGLAAAPPDYSGTFEDVSRVYGETVKASGEMWGEIAKASALIGGELIKNSIDWNSAVQKVYDAGGTENVVNEIYALKDELRELGPLSGVFGNRDTRKKRMEILTRKNKLFSEIDKWGEALDNAAVAVESNNLDYNLMGLEKQETLNAIIASNTNNKITVAGHYARITKDDNGGLSYTIYNEDGSEATYSDGTTRTISLRDFQSLLTENVADKENVYGNAMNELSTSAENLGATYGGEYGKYHSGKMRGALNNMTNTANDRRRLMRTAFGIDNKSFYEHITEGEENVETAGLWTLMMKDLAAGEVKGELAVATGQRGKLLANIKDTDNSGGISQEEINNQWMAFTGSLLSGESDFSKQAIIDYADKKFKLNFEFGARQKALAKNAGNDDSDTSVSARSLGWGVEYPSTGGIGQGGKKVDYSTLEKRRNDLLNFEEQVLGEYFEYRWDGKNWFAYDGGVKVESIEGLGLDIKDGISMKDIAKIEGLKKLTDKGYSVFDQKIAKDTKTKKDEGGTGLGVSKNMLSNKENIEQELTKAYGENFLKKYYLVGGMDRKEPRFGGLFGSTVITNNTIQVVDKETNTVVYTFQAGDAATVKGAEDMNKFFSEDFLSLIPGEEI